MSAVNASVEGGTVRKTWEIGKYRITRETYITIVPEQRYTPRFRIEKRNPSSSVTGITWSEVDFGLVHGELFDLRELINHVISEPK